MAFYSKPFSAGFQKPPSPLASHLFVGRFPFLNQIATVGNAFLEAPSFLPLACRESTLLPSAFLSPASLAFSPACISNLVCFGLSGVGVGADLYCFDFRLHMTHEGLQNFLFQSPYFFFLPNLFFTVFWELGSEFLLYDIFLFRKNELDPTWTQRYMYLFPLPQDIE